MEEEKKQIFRKESLDRIASPEQLNDYIRTTKPGVWIVLITIILFLVAFFAWASIGKLETKAPGKAIVNEGTAQISVLGGAAVNAGMTVRIGESEFTISAVDVNEYGQMIAYAPVSLANGNYDVEIVVESISPISFLFSS